MRIRPLGPEGVEARIRELQSRMATRLGTSSKAAPTKFGAMPGALAGSINPNSPLSPFDSGVRVVGEPGAPSELLPLIDRAATDAGVDAKLFEALIGVESNYNPKAVSERGARGLAQLMPGTATGLGVTDAFDPEQSLRAGARYLAQMLRENGGSTEMALAAYNCGPGTVRRFGSIPPQAHRYVERVMSKAEALRNQ